jgi:hypothetical protein
MDGDLLYIEKAIKEDKIDYVVMGTEGAAGWSTFFWELIRVRSRWYWSAYFCIPHKQNLKNRNNRVYDPI